MVYTVYKITNDVNVKIYYGYHETDNPHDNYMGSGKAIRAAIKKYGIEHFFKSILLETEFRDEAFQFERLLTNKSHKYKNTYNLKPGGEGGFVDHHYISSLGGKTAYVKRVGIHALTSEQHKEHGKKGAINGAVKGGKISGKIAFEKKIGIHALTSEQHSINGKKGVEARRRKKLLLDKNIQE